MSGPVVDVVVRPTMDADQFERKTARIRRTLQRGGSVRLHVVLRGRERRRKELAWATARTLVGEFSSWGEASAWREGNDGVKVLISPRR